MPPERDQRILLGHITGAHGIRGEVSIRSFTAEPQDIAAYGPLHDVAGRRTFEVTVVRTTPKGAVIARVKGVPDRNGAEALAGTELYVDRSRLPQTDDGEFYHADLIGLTAVSTDGTVVGEVVAVQNYGAGDLLEIRLATGNRTDLLPFTDTFVPEVDLAHRRIVVVFPADQPDDDQPDDDQPAG